MTLVQQLSESAVSQKPAEEPAAEPVEPAVATTEVEDRILEVKMRLEDKPEVEEPAAPPKREVQYMIFRYIVPLNPGKWDESKQVEATYKLKQLENEVERLTHEVASLRYREAMRQARDLRSRPPLTSLVHENDVPAGYAIYPRGGVVIAASLVDGEVDHWVMSVCSMSDTFDRDDGKRRAYARLRYDMAFVNQFFPSEVKDEPEHAA